MSNSNQEVVYATGGFSPRATGQRYDRDLIPDFLNPDCSVALFALRPQPNNLPVSCVALGTFTPLAGHGKGRLHTAWCITLANGLKVPAYSLGGTYNVCQHHGFKAYQG